MKSKKWNWQQDDWPLFSYDWKRLEPLENEYSKESGISFGVMRHLSKEDLEEFRIEIICNEALKTSEIEGEILDRDSLQSSICKEFGVGEKYLHGTIKPEEAGIAMMMKDLYTNFDSPLTHERIGTCFLLKKVSKIPKVKNIKPPLIQAQHVVLVSGGTNLSQDKNHGLKN